MDHAQRVPLQDPTEEPTVEPTLEPSFDPTVQPTEYPTLQPTVAPSRFEVGIDPSGNTPKREWDQVGIGLSGNC